MMLIFPQGLWTSPLKGTTSQTSFLHSYFYYEDSFYHSTKSVVELLIHSWQVDSKDKHLLIVVLHSGFACPVVNLTGSARLL